MSHLSSLKYYTSIIGQCVLKIESVFNAQPDRKLSRGVIALRVCWPRGFRKTVSGKPCYTRIHVYVTLCDSARCWINSKRCWIKSTPENLTEFSYWRLFNRNTHLKWREFILAVKIVLFRNWWLLMIEIISTRLCTTHQCRSRYVILVLHI